MANILVVDDEAHMRLLITEMLRSQNHIITEATNGADAIQKITGHPPELIITDLVMPEKNGIDLIMEAKKQNPNTKVLAVSGGGGINGRFDYLAVAKVIGAGTILKKPFTKDELCKAVKDILS